MEWLNDNEIVVSENDTQQLQLSFNPVNDSIHGKIFTCTVTRRDDMHMNETVKQNITLTAKGMM